MATKKKARPKRKATPAKAAKPKAPPASPASAPPVVELDALARRAGVLHEQGHFEAARQVALEVITRKQEHVEALLALANALRDLGRFDEALNVLRKILTVSPGHTQALAAAALTFFYKEDWPNAWKAFDVRFKMMNPPPRVTATGPDGKTVPKPVWRSGPPPLSLLVLGEQGMGDTIQFARFLPMLTQSGVRVVCVVQRRLFRLLDTLEANVEFRPREESGSVSGIAAWTPIMHLPQALGLGPKQLTPKIPYLAAEPDRVARWRARIGEQGFKVGIVWQGNPDPRIDRGRSAPLAAFAPLAEISGVRLISLQKDKGIEQIAAVPFAKRIETLGDFDVGLDAFVDSAAVLECLDLVVSVDTSIAHLAGALGRPVFILLKRVGADWRWLFNRSDTVWYPSARLFRQRAQGDWSELLGRVAAEVRSRAERKSLPEGAIATAPISIGELFDKLTILEIKSERITDPAKLANVRREWTALSAARDRLPLGDGKIAPLVAELKSVNEKLWEIEDEIRACESNSDFGRRFVELARSVYLHNDRRAALKAEINALSGSALREEKSYKPY